VSQPLHFLRVMDQGAERANRSSVCNGFFDHLNGALYAKAKSIFVCE
jgi:hypothetical protein